MMIEMLLGGSALILAVLLARAVFGRRMGARLRYWLWLPVLLRLLVPVSFGHLAVFPANFARVAREPDALVVYAAPVWSGTGMRVLPDGRVCDPNSFGYARANRDGTVTRYASRRALPDALPVVWLGGMTAAAVWFGLCNVLFGREVRKSRSLLRHVGKTPVYVAETPSPCLFGLLRPSIYVPEEVAEDEGKLSWVLVHETAHLRHGDHVWAFLRMICLSVWWFHPLVWAAAALSRQDCELYCDDAVIRRLGEDRRTEYGETLLSLAGGRGRAAADFCTASTLSRGGKPLRRRIRAIARRSGVKAWAVAAAGVMVALAALCAFSGAREPWEAASMTARNFFQSGVRF